MRLAYAVVIVQLSVFASPLLSQPVVEESKATPREEVPLRNWLPALPSWQTPLENDSEGRISAMALPSAASHFIALTPCRVVDTRNPNGPHGGPIVSGGVARPFNIITGPCSGIPVAAAYSLNIAVTGSTPGSIQFLTAYPAETARPLVATMNFDGGETTSNAALVPADATGAVEIYASADTHVIIDINGYIKEGVVTSVTPGAGLAGGGTGSVGLSIANGGVGATQLAAGAVTNGAIEDGAISAGKIAINQVVKDVNGARDSVTVTGSSGVTVTTLGNAISVTGAPVPGSLIVGLPNDTTLLGAGYSELPGSGFIGWKSTNLAGAPAGRDGHTAVWTGTKMIVWGGRDPNSGTLLNSGGLYDLATDSWTATSLASAPSARYTHTAVWTNTRMIIWGGNTSAGVTNTGALFDPAANSWVETNGTGAPSARAQHTAVWTGANMIIWGGLDSALTNTGGRYNTATDSWTATPTAGAPTARRNHTAIYDGYAQHMIVWGGYDGTAVVNTGGRYADGGAWTPTSTTGAPAARQNHTATLLGFGSIIVWGGDSAAGLTNSGARYDFFGNSWLPITSVGAPSGRIGHTAVFSNGQLVIWGGNDGTAPTNTGALWDQGSDSWKPLSPTNAPSARDSHTVVHTQGFSSYPRMIVWGGTGVSGEGLNSGAQWIPLSFYMKN